MKILFIYNGAENLGIEYLSSMLKSKGHETSLLFDPAVFSGDVLINNEPLSRLFSIDEKIVGEAVGQNPDLIAFSSYTGNYRWCLKIAESIKRQSNSPIVFGGVHVTAVPELVIKNNFVDYAIIGEGEYALLDLVESLQKNLSKKDLSGIPNLCFEYKGKAYINPPRPYIKELDSLPFPDKDLFIKKAPLLVENYLIIASRGCPYNCAYCSNNLFHNRNCNEKQHVRRRSSKNVIEELKWAKSKWNIKLVKFVDDVFSSSREWLEEFMPLYKSEINLPFFCSVHPNAVSGEIAGLLKSGGCWLVTIGVQSGSERIRTEIFNRYGGNEQILKSILHIKKAGIKISVDNIFGAPSETEDDLKLGLELYNKAKPDRILTFWLVYYPATKIINSAIKNGVISQKEIDDINHGIIGFTHNVGSVDRKKINMYLKYQLLFQLRGLFHNDNVYGLFSKLAGYLPFKGFITMLIVFLNGLKNRDVNVFYLLRYVWTKKNVP